MNAKRIIIKALPKTFRGAAHYGYTVYWIILNTKVFDACQLIYTQVKLFALSLFTVKNKQVLNFSNLEDAKTTDTVFVFGSGASLNNISKTEWKNIKQHDSIGFSGSFLLQKINFNYLILKAWNETPTGTIFWEKDTQYVLDSIKTNKYLDNTIFLFPKGITATFTNRLIACKLWPTYKKFYLYSSDRFSQLPNRDFKMGFAHGKGTLCTAINLAICLGYKKIVLIGVDLYDNRYFWLKANETLGWSDQEKRTIVTSKSFRGSSSTANHNTFNNGIVQYIGNWAEFLKNESGQELYCYNPKSLMCEVLPIYDCKDKKIN